MGRKGIQTKRNIAEAARRLFATKGFEAVTMAEICEAVDISRGGLYRHFGSTEAVFVYMIDLIEEHDVEGFQHAREQKVAAKVIFDEFLNHRLYIMSHSEINIDKAFDEFAASSEEGKARLNRYIQTSVDLLIQIINMGCEEGVFTSENPSATAKHIMWLMEGMGLHNAVVPLTEEEIAEQRKAIYELLHYQQ